MDFNAEANILIAVMGAIFGLVGIVTDQELPKIFGALNGLISLGISAWILLEKLM